MNISLNCKVSLSKKMRNLLQNGGTLTLSCSNLNGGKGNAVLTLSDDSSRNLDINDLLNKETSIMITPTSEAEAKPVTNILAEPQRSPVDRMAVQEPPQQNLNNSYYQKDEIQTPAEFAVTDLPAFNQHVKTFEELIRAVNEARHSSSEIEKQQIYETDSPRVRMQKAAINEQRELQESIGKDAYIVNDKYAALSIADIGMDLPLNCPKNLGTISAKKLASSRELWGAIRNKRVKLISPDEADYLLKNGAELNTQYVPQMEVYDSALEAEDRAFAKFGNAYATSMDLGGRGMNGPSEEMRMLQMSGGMRPQGQFSNLSGSTRQSFHGSAQDQGGFEDNNLYNTYMMDPQFAQSNRRQIGRESSVNSQGIKTISRSRW